MGRFADFKEKLYRVGLFPLLIALFVSFSVLTGVIPFFESGIDVRIRAVGEKNSSSKGTEVWMTRAPYLDLATTYKGWEKRDGVLISYQGIGQPAEINYCSRFSPSDELVFNSHPYSGIVEIQIGHETKRLDLYSPTQQEVRVPLAKKVNIGLTKFIKTACFFALFYMLVVGAFAYFRTDGYSHDESLNIGYLDRLDHLRFVAAGLVVLYHYFHDIVGLSYWGNNPVLSLIDEGHTGVSLFMVLSGFIFGKIGYNRELDYRQFIVNRIIRIYPLYFVALFISHSSHRLEFSKVDVLFFLFPFFNQIDLAKVPQFGQLWTVGVEFQFYLIFPFLSTFINRKGFRYLASLLGLLIGIRYLLYMYEGSVRDIAYWTILGRLDQFLLGIGAAYLYQQKRFSVMLESRINCLLSVAVIVILIYAFDFSGGYSNAPQAKWWIIWSFAEGLGWSYLALSYLCVKITIPISISKLFSTLGALSFSIYVMHYMVIPYVHRYIGRVHYTGINSLDITIEGVFVVLPLVVSFSYVTHRLIEMPFLSLRKSYASKSDHSSSTNLDDSKIIPLLGKRI